MYGTFNRVYRVMALTVIGHVYLLAPVPATAEVQLNWPPLAANFASLYTD